MAAARQQHVLSVAVRRRLSDEGLSTEHLAEALGQSVDQLWRKLAGVVPASVQDLLSWSVLTGRRLDVEVDTEGLAVPWPVRPPAAP